MAPSFKPMRALRLAPLVLLALQPALPPPPAAQGGGGARQIPGEEDRRAGHHDDGLARRHLPIAGHRTVDSRGAAEPIETLARRPS